VKKSKYYGEKQHLMKSIEQRALESTVAGVILFALTFIQSIVFVPLFLRYWGSETYGVWLTMYSFIFLMRTFDAGHQAYVGNEFNKFFHTDKKYAQKVLGSSVRIALSLGLLELIIYFIILTLNQHRNWVGIDPAQHQVIPGIISFLVMWMLVGSVGGILVRIILPLGAYAQSLYLTIVIKLLESICIVLALVFQLSITVLSISISISWFVYASFLLYYIKNLMPDFYPWWKNGSWKLGFSNLIKSSALTANNFVEQFNTSGTLIAISNFVGVAKVPVFSTVRTIANVFTQASTIILNPLVPDLIKFYSTKEYDKIKDIIVTNWFIGTIFINLPLMVLTPFMPTLFNWWTNGEIEFNMGLYLTLSFSVALINYGKIFVLLITCLNELWAISVITITRFVVLIALAIFILRWYGLTQIGWAFIAAEMLASVLIPIFFSLKLEGLKNLVISSREFILPSLSIIILGFSFLSSYNNGTLIVSLFLFVVMIYLAKRQWLFISKSVRERLLRQIPIAVFNR
jgi:O-antigen/teichoic acid export membrane protein